MYLIEILHQTTTRPLLCLALPGCILSKFYIKPQLSRQKASCYCVVSYRNSTSNHNNRSSHNIGQLVVSYRNSTSNHNKIPGVHVKALVVSYRNSTSNHNSSETTIVIRRLYLIEILHQTTTPDNQYHYKSGLYLIEILHQTTTRSRLVMIRAGCILSKFYIKPQLCLYALRLRTVVSYRNSTSNHNTRHSSVNTNTVVSYRNSTSNHNE